MSTKTKAVEVGALGDDALAELSRETRQAVDVAALDDDKLDELLRETRQALDDRGRRPITRAEALERLQGQREAVTAALAAAVDESAARIAMRADPGMPDLGCVALAALSDPAHLYWAALEEEIATSERFGDADDDPADLRALAEKLDREARRRALDRLAEEAREGVVRA